MKRIDSTNTVVSAYLATVTTGTAETVWKDKETAPGNDKIRICRVAVKPEGDDDHILIDMRTPFVMEVEYWTLKPDLRIHPSFLLFNEQRVIVLGTMPREGSDCLGTSKLMGLYRSVCHVPGDLLNAGIYSVKLGIVLDCSRVIFRLDDCIQFEIVDSAETRAGYWGKRGGVIRPNLKWDTARMDSPL